MAEKYFEFAGAGFTAPWALQKPLYRSNCGSQSPMYTIWRLGGQDSPIQQGAEHGWQFVCNYVCIHVLFGWARKFLNILTGFRVSCSLKIDYGLFHALCIPLRATNEGSRLLSLDSNTLVRTDPTPPSWLHFYSSCPLRL